MSYNIFSSTAPAMPKPSKGTEFVKFAISQASKDMREGTYINVNRKKDGTLYPTFNRPQFTEKFTFQDFCLQAAKELWVISGQEKGQPINMK